MAEQNQDTSSDEELIPLTREYSGPTRHFVERDVDYNIKLKENGKKSLFSYTLAAGKELPYKTILRGKLKNCLEVNTLLGTDRH